MALDEAQNQEDCIAWIIRNVAFNSIFNFLLMKIKIVTSDILLCLKLSETQIKIKN